MSRLRDDPAWRAMFKRIHATYRAERLAEAQRWCQLSAAERWAEMADMARRWRGPADDLVRRVVSDVEDTA